MFYENKVGVCVRITGFSICFQPLIRAAVVVFGHRGGRLSDLERLEIGEQPPEENHPGYGKSWKGKNIEY